MQKPFCTPIRVRTTVFPDRALLTGLYFQVKYNLPKLQTLCFGDIHLVTFLHTESLIKGINM